MDLRQLRYLIATVDGGGIRRASRQLYLTQPAISKALRQLESELGVELIRRSTRGIELTRSPSASARESGAAWRIATSPQRAGR
jgi:DNA-binding transcriptional LysR family regulator